MLIDSAKIYVKAGDGGNGAITWHREKYVSAGGPDGGDGGKGGNIIFVGDNGKSTLLDFRYQNKYIAESGGKGDGNKRRGKSGDDLTIVVPCGTIIKDTDTDKVLVDITEPGQEFVALLGGKGGKGNSHFATPSRQAPNFAENGRPGEEANLVLELKLIAEVGLVGFPSVGKSTILSMVSSAKPKIAEYHFTTLEPNLGMVQIGMDQDFILADIPGLIEGAHDGLGLGINFLKHIERTKFIIHVLDVAGVEGRDPIKDFDIINNELAAFNPFLADKQQVVAANKMDLTGAEENFERVKVELESRGYDVFPISAVTGEGLKELMYYTYSKVVAIPDVVFTAPIDNDMVIYTMNDREKPFTVTKVEDAYVITGKWMLKLFGTINLSDSESLQYFQRVMKSKGVIDSLIAKGCTDGDTVRIADFEFDFVE